MFLSLLILLCFAELWSIPSFTVEPDYSVVGNKVIITFTVSESTDVDISVINPSSGRIVRHLAAGLLGGTFDPPEPLKRGFTQSIEWDGLDDYGVWVGSSSMEILVRLNVRPVLKHTMRFLKGNEMRYLNTKLIVRNPLYFPDTGKFIDLNCYKFYNSYGDQSLYPTVIGMDMSVNDETDEILLKIDKGAFIAPCGVSWWYAKMAVYDGLTGSLTPKRQINLKPNSGPLAKDSVAVYGPDLSLGEFYYSWDGRYIFYDEPGPWKGSWRFDAKTGLAAPYPNGKEYVTSLDAIGPASILRPFSGRGVGVGHDGSLYYPTFAKNKGLKWGFGSGVYGTEDFTMTLHKFDSLGNRVKNNMIPMHCFPSMGARVDFKGNIYLGALVKPFGENVPPEIAGDLSKDLTGLYSAAYPWYGSILKFSPDGGSILPNSSGGHMTTSQNRLKVDGASWVYYGASIQTSFAYTGGLFYKKECCCFSPRFDVDRFSRVIFPNLFENNYVCLDANKNILFKIHNRDFVKDSTIVGTGSTVQATDRGLYISDGTNNQILCFSWEAATEKKLSISTLGTENSSNLLSGAILSATASPTPFSNTVQIAVSCKKNSSPIVTIYDIAGKRVKELNMVAKKGELSLYSWDGLDNAKRQLRNGFYFYRARSGESAVSGRMTLIK